MKERKFYIPIEVHMKVFSDKSISNSAKNLFTVLLWHVNEHSNKCRLKINTLMKELGMSRPTVFRAIEQLEQKGIIGKNARHGTGNCNEYTINYQWGNSTKNDTIKCTNSETGIGQKMRLNGIKNETPHYIYEPVFKPVSLTSKEKEEIIELEKRFQDIQSMTDNDKDIYLTNRQQNRPIRTPEALQHPLWHQLYGNKIGHRPSQVKSADYEQC